MLCPTRSRARVQQQSRNNMEESYKTFKILCIDGGGIKGLYSSKILEHLEEKYKCRISDYFDMLCGTSTGGLIALGLSLGIPAKEMSAIYEDHGLTIFPRRTKIGGFLRQAIWRGKYSDEPLRKVLTDVFGERKIAESNNLLCIPSYSYTDARPWIFKFDHREGDLDRDNKALYVDVALATSAAPTYFPLAEISYYDNKQFVDGGVWANDPTMVGLIEALTYFVGKGKPYDKVEILSISSLTSKGGKRTGLRRARAFFAWRDELFQTSLTGQSSFSEYTMKKLHELSGMPIEYVRIPAEALSPEQQMLVQLDLASKDAIDLIKGKGNDRGELVRKDPTIAKFFHSLKTYKTQ